MKNKQEDGFYYKQNGRYRRVYETPALYSDGIWLVQTGSNCASRQNILKLGELSELYPYAQMALDIDDLASFIANGALNSELKTLKRHSDGSYSYTYGSGADQARALLKFLSMSKEKRREFLSNLVKENMELERVRQIGSKYEATRLIKDEHIQKEIDRLKNEIEKLEQLLIKNKNAKQN